MPKTETEKRTYALSFETVHASIASVTMEEMLRLLSIIENDLDNPSDVLNSFKSLVGLACQNAKREADNSLLDDLRKLQPAAQPLT